MSNIDKVFQLYLQGNSLRTLERRCGIPKSTLSFKFKKKYGDNYTQLRNNNGVLPILKEYMLSELLPPKDRAVVKRWFNQNIENIMSSELYNRDKPLLTDRQIDRLTLLECGHKSKDWGDIISATFTTTNI